MNLIVVILFAVLFFSESVAGAQTVLLRGTVLDRSIKNYLGLGVILTGICLMGQTVFAGTAEPGLKITLHLQNYAHLEFVTLNRAKEEATRIYDEIGVETLWLDAPLRPIDPRPHLTAEIYINILPRAMEEIGLPSGSLGLAPGSGHNRSRLYVFYDRVEGLSRRQITAVTEGKTYRWAKPSQILGYAIAHEIGHLLGLDVHSPLGIMSARWRLNDLLKLSYGDLAFTPQQAAVIRAEVRIRQQESLGGAEVRGMN